MLPPASSEHLVIYEDWHICMVMITFEQFNPSHYALSRNLFGFESRRYKVHRARV